MDHAQRTILAHEYALQRHSAAVWGSVIRRGTTRERAVGHGALVQVHERMIATLGRALGIAPAARRPPGRPWERAPERRGGYETRDHRDVLDRASRLLERSGVVGTVTLRR